MKGDDGYASIQKEKEGFVMRWIAISESWRTVNEEVKKDVESAVRKIIKNGDGDKL